MVPSLKNTALILQEICLISNGNRTEWSPIRSVIIRVINKIGRPRSGSPICLITSMITDTIGRHKVLLPINHKYNKIREKKIDKAKPAKDLSSLGQKSHSGS